MQHSLLISTEYRCILWKPNMHYCVQKSSNCPKPEPGEFSLRPLIPACKSHLNIILSFTPTSSMFILPFRFSTKTLDTVHPAWRFHTNNIWRVLITMLLTTHFSQPPTTSYLSCPHKFLSKYRHFYKIESKTHSILFPQISKPFRNRPLIKTPVPKREKMHLSAWVQSVVWIIILITRVYNEYSNIILRVRSQPLFTSLVIFRCGARLPVAEWFIKLNLQITTLKSKHPNKRFLRTCTPAWKDTNNVKKWCRCSMMYANIKGNHSVNLTVTVLP